MILIVDDALFGNGQVRVIDMFCLLRGAAQREHSLFVTIDPERPFGPALAPNFDAWRTGLSVGLCEELDIVCDLLSWVPARVSSLDAERLFVSGRSNWAPTHGSQTLGLAEATVVVTLPLRVLVENALRDGAFIRRVMPPPWRDRMQAWQTRGLVVFEHAGGVEEMAEIVKHFGDDARARRSTGHDGLVWRSTHFMVYDHDGEAPDCPGPGARKMALVCEAASLGARSHRLHRRSQEQYLPREALDSAAEKLKEDATALKAQIQQHFASGLPARHFTKLPQEGELKKAFFRAENEDWDWDDQWFRDDGSAHEMTDLAEKLAWAL